MALLRWDPWGELATLQRDVNELISRSGPASNRASGILPPMDAFRAEDGMTVRMELPGMRPDDVEVAVHEGVLTVSGERKLDTDVAQDAWLRRERVFGRFERSFALPEGTNADEIKADFHDGLLELKVPHPPERKPRRIHIGGSSESETVDVS